MALLRGIRPLTLAVVLFLVLLFAHSGRYDQRWELVRESIRTGRLGLNSLSGLSSSSLAAQVFTVPDPKDLRENDKHAHQWYTEAKLRQLAACMATGTCPPNADKVVIFGCLHCHMAIFGKYMGGEGIWCRGMVDSLQRQGYTVLFAWDDFEYMYHIYRQIPDLVVAVIASDDGYHGKPNDVFKTKDRPDGIPAWKYFWFYYFPRFDGNVIASKWIISAEPGTGNDGLTPPPQGFTYLGYALEASDAPKIPHHKRPMRAYILAKRVQYFYDIFYFPNYIKRDLVTQAYDELRLEFPDFEFVGSFIDDRLPDEREKTGDISLPRGVRNLYPLNATEFDYEVANSRVLVGLGSPGLSPSPYRALAQGVPFVNPHLVGDPNLAHDPLHWRVAQHDSLRLEKPPVVYQVAENNYTEFVSSIRAALKTPCPPTTYKRMEQDMLDARMREFMEHDWRAEAEELLKRRAEGEPVPDYIHIKEFEL